MKRFSCYHSGGKVLHLLSRLLTFVGYVLYYKSLSFGLNFQEDNCHRNFFENNQPFRSDKLWQVLSCRRLNLLMGDVLNGYILVCPLYTCGYLTLKLFIQVLIANFVQSCKWL